MAYDYIEPLSLGGALPLSPSEIDNLPDAKRIWATISEACGNLKEDSEEQIELLTKEANEIEEERDRSKGVLKDMADAMESARFIIRYNEKTGRPTAILHGIIADTPEEEAILDQLQDRLYDVLEEFLDNHFRDEQEVLYREDGLR